MSASWFTIDRLKAVGLAGPIISGVVTLIRLADRVYTRRFGYDDGWAAFSLVLFLLFVPALFIHLGSIDPTQLAFATRVSLYYILAQTFYGVVWCARMSILFSVIRICPVGPMKKLLWGLAGSFIFVWIILFAQVFWVCEAEPHWKDPIVPQCALGENVAIAQVISDVYADSMLIIAPLRLLWNLKTNAAQRNRLIFVFAASFTTTVASLVHAYYVLRVSGVPEVFVAIVEMSVSLTICNLAVVVALVARLFNLGNGKSSLAQGSYQMSRSARTGVTQNSVVQISTVGHTDTTKSMNFNPEDSFLDDRHWGQKGQEGIQVRTAQVVLKSPPDNYAGNYAV